MPHLMLKFSAEREVQDLAGQLVPNGKEHISFIIIDTDKGKITELEADAKNIRQVEREPNWGELKTATETLGKEPGARTTEEYRQLQAERDSYRQKMTSAQADLVAKNQLILQLNGEIQKLKEDDIDKLGGKDLLANALDSHIEELAASQRFEEYENAKKIFRRLTGHPWVGEDDDDEEGDLSG